MNPVDPDIDVVPIGQVALPELPILVFPDRGQPREVGRAQPGRVVSQQHGQRFAEVARGQPAEIENRQHLGHRKDGGPAHVGRKDPAGEPLALARGIDPFVVHPRRSHLHCARPTRDLPGLGLTVADHQPPPARVQERREPPGRRPHTGPPRPAGLPSASAEHPPGPRRPASESRAFLPFPSSCRVPSAWVASPFTGLPAGVSR